MEKRDPDDSDDDFPQAAEESSEKSSAVHKRSRLDSKQFKKVSQSVERFDQYLFKSRGTDADTARDANLRYDNYHDPRKDDRRSVGPDYHNAHRLHPLPELIRSPSGRGSVSDGSARSPRIDPRDLSDDEDEDEDESDSEGSGGGRSSGKYRIGSGSTPVREPLFSSHSTPAATKTKGSRDRNYRQKGMASGDALSPDDTGYGRGGSISSGRANSYGHGGYQ